MEPKRASVAINHTVLKRAPLTLSASKRQGLSNTLSHIQPKFKIGVPNDKYEQEADRVADQVMRMPEHAGSGRTGITSNIIIPNVQRLCAGCQGDLEQNYMVQTKVASGHTVAVTPNVANGIQSLKGGGQPLPETNRNYFEPRFGHDFRQVRIHTGSRAADLARGINASAFTLGQEVVFGAGQYRPHSSDGQRLIAHELTHVVQQDGVTFNPGSRLQRLVSDDYSTIEDRLSYGLIDWAITDSDARDVLNILNGLSEQDLADTVAAMERGGYTERLLDNISSSDQQRFSDLIIRINRNRPVRRRYEWVEDRLSYGFFDWAITDSDAHSVLLALKSLGARQLTLVLSRMVDEGLFDRFMDNISTEDRDRNTAFIQRLLAIRRDLLPSHVPDVRYSSRRVYGFGRRDTTKLYGLQNADNLVPESAFSQQDSTYIDYPKKWTDALGQNRIDRLGRLANDCGVYARELIDLAGRTRRDERISRPGIALAPVNDLQPGEAYYIRPRGGGDPDGAVPEEIFSPWNNRERVRKGLTRFHVATVVARDNRTVMTSEVNAAFAGHNNPWFAMYSGNSGFYRTFRREYQARGRDPELYRW